jgi:hypothetical protein
MFENNISLFTATPKLREQESDKFTSSLPVFLSSFRPKVQLKLIYQSKMKINTA